MHMRIAEPRDGQDIAEIYCPIVRDTTISFEQVPPNADEMSERIETVLRTHPWLVLERDGTVMAYAYGTQHRTRAAYQWSCDVSVYVAEGLRRTGAARALYENLFKTLAGLGFATAFAGITLPNDPSVGFHTFMGFELVGTYPCVGFKHGAWRDVAWWHKPLQTFENDPPSPRLFSQHQYVFAPSS